MTTKQIKNIISYVFRSQIVISCGQIRTIISNGAGKYKYYKTKDILFNIDTGKFFPYQIKQN